LPPARSTCHQQCFAMLTKADTEGLRQHNRARVLSALRKSGALSHTEIAAKTGLSSATVSAITGDLSSDGTLERAENLSSPGRGRPRLLFRPARRAGFIVTIRITSAAIQYSLVDYGGVLSDRIETDRIPPELGVTAFLDDIRSSIKRLLRRSGAKGTEILALAVTSKGLVDPDDPVLVWSPIFGMHRIDFQMLLDTEFCPRLSVLNETQLLAIALYNRAQASGTPSSSLIALSLGHSIGLGIVQVTGEGTIQTHAPNFGHMLHHPGGALCRCGSQGCIEAYAGFYAILRTAFEVPPDTLPAKFVPLSEIEKIATKARRGDRMAQYAFRQAGQALGNGLARVISLFQRMPIVVAGPGISFFDLLEEGIGKGLSQSLGIRLEGLPSISISGDEDNLVHQGTVQQTLADIDRTIMATRHQASA